MKAIVSFVLLASLAAGAPLCSADPNPAAVATAPVHGEGALASKLAAVVAQLDLTDAQKSKIVPILEQEAAELRALKQESSAARREKLRRFREINQRASGEIRALLTPEQQKKYEELRAAARAEFRQKMQERRRAGG